MTALLRVVYLDDRIVLVYRDGSVQELLPGGHPRPGCAHATARARG